MTKMEMENKIQELQVWEQLMEEAKAEAEAIKDQLKAEMVDRNTDEIVTDRFVISWKEIISNRFDTTNFKKQFGELYKNFTKQTTSRRFTISA